MRYILPLIFFFQMAACSKPDLTGVAIVKGYLRDKTTGQGIPNERIALGMGKYDGNPTRYFNQLDSQGYVYTRDDGYFEVTADASRWSFIPADILRGYAKLSSSVYKSEKTYYHGPYQEETHIDIYACPTARLDVMFTNDLGIDSDNFKYSLQFSRGCLQKEDPIPTLSITLPSLSGSYPAVGYVHESDSYVIIHSETQKNGVRSNIRRDSIYLSAGASPFYQIRY